MGGGGEVGVGRPGRLEEEEVGRGEVEDVPRVEEEEADGGMGGGHSSTTNTHKTHYYYQTKGRDGH